MWQRPVGKKRELDRLRPLAPDTLAVLAAWYDVELTWSSNAIEGNTLSRTETAIVLEKGLTVGCKPLKHHLEAIGHKAALDYVRVLAGRAETLREGDIREIHRLVLARIDPEEAGRYSNRQRAILGSTVLLPSPAEIPPLMADFSRWLATAPIGPDTAFTAHARLVAIHPFSDGNGRTARLLMNLLLLRGGWPPVAIGPEQRAAYIGALEILQSATDTAPYDAFMAERLGASLDHHLALLHRSVDDGGT